MRILLADDQVDFRDSLRDLLSTARGIEVVGEASNGREALEVALRLLPDVILMDIRMPVMDGIAATAAVKARLPDACILVLTTFDEDRLVRDAIRAGAAGYLLKGTPIDDMLAIFDIATRGYVAIGKGVTLSPKDRAGERNSNHAARERCRRLSEREREIWALLGAGLTNRDIGRALSLGLGTVKNYVSSLLGVLGVRHRTEAALLWRSIGEE